MRLGDSAGRTDAGRVRRRNEDSFVLDPPLFAVADGMGGAQAGEVASRLAAAAFREYHDADRLEPAERVEAIIQEANRRIYERARTDAEASGMGTTVTAAILTNGRVSIGHVGDSRAYRIRNGELEQLTEDHSLVADLMRSGRLTPEEADAHPQRSVITRALGNRRGRRRRHGHGRRRARRPLPPLLRRADNDGARGGHPQDRAGGRQPRRGGPHPRPGGELRWGRGQHHGRPLQGRGRRGDRGDPGRRTARHGRGARGAERARGHADGHAARPEG